MAAEPIRARLVSADEPSWQRYVESSEAAGPFHHPAWTALISSVYGLQALAIVFEARDGHVVGGLPVVETGGRLRSRRWSSLPFTDECAPLLDPSITASEVVRALQDVRREHGVESIEVRAGLAGDGESGALRGVMHTLALADPDAQWASLRSEMRRNVRKAEAAGLTAREATRSEDLTRTYFALHVETRHRLGVPSQPRRFFTEFWRQLVEPGVGKVVLVHQGPEAIAGGVFLEWNGRVVYKYGASDRRQWQLRPNNLLLWHGIRSACEAGAHTFDFGRSDLEDEGLRAFKSRWGADEVPLAYTVVGGSAQPGSARAARIARPVIRTAPTWFGRAVGALLYRYAG